MKQPTIRSRTAPVQHDVYGTDALELRAQAAAMYVMLRLTNRALAAGLSTPHWTIDSVGNVNAEFAGPDALRALDRWRRQLPESVTSSDRRLHEMRWTVASTVQDVSVHLVAIVPAPAQVGGAR